MTIKAHTQTLRTQWRKKKRKERREPSDAAPPLLSPLFVDGLIVAFLFLSFPIFYSFRHCAGNRSHSPFPPPPTDDKTTDRERERILHLPQKSGGGGGKDLHGFSLSAHGDAGKGKRKRENEMRCGGGRRLLPAAERLSMHLPIQKRKTPTADKFVHSQERDGGGGRRETRIPLLHSPLRRGFVHGGNHDVRWLNGERIESGAIKMR